MPSFAMYRKRARRRADGRGAGDLLDEAADASVGSLAKCDKHGLATSMGWRRGLAALEVMRLTDLFERVACATGMSRVQR